MDDVEAGRLGDLVPRYHVRFPREETEESKLRASKLGSARFKGRLVPFWYERLCLARWSLDTLTGQPFTNDPLAAVPIGGRLLELRTRRHRELEEYHRRGDPLYLGYPIRRLHTLRPDLIVIAASVKTNHDGSSSTFLWGALPHQVVYETCARQPILSSSSLGWGGLKRGPSLGEYGGDLLSQLLGEAAP